ncbi:MAG: hypothetical protein V1926_01050 [Candidatus Peregrinibacteria bacterium]
MHIRNLFGGDDDKNPNGNDDQQTGETGAFNAGDDIGEMVGEGHDPIEDKQ